MAYKFKTVDEFEQLTSLNTSDKFLVCRNEASELGYTTYNTTFAQLSASIVDRTEGFVAQQGLLTSISQLTETSKTSAIAGNVGKQVVDYIKQISSNYLDKTSLCSQIVSGDVVFKGDLSCETTQLNSMQDVVNVEAMSSYVENKISAIPLFSTMFIGQALNNRPIWLSNVIPENSSISGKKIRVYFKYSYAVQSTTARTIKTALSSDGKDILATVFSGNTSLKKGDAVDCGEYFEFTVPRDKDASSVYILLNNGNVNTVDVAMSILVIE